MIEWIKLIPVFGDFFLKVHECRMKRKQKKIIRAHKRYAIHIKKGCEFYRDVRIILNKSFEETNCQYVMFFDYHNGTENAVGVPYEKFELQYYNSDDVRGADFSTNRLGIVQEYSILDFVNDGYMHTYNMEDIKHIDNKFYKLITDEIPDSKYVVTFNLRPFVADMGSLIFISTNKKPVLEEIANTGAEINSLYGNLELS